MAKPSHPFDVLHLRRRLPKFKAHNKRDIIRRFLFGTNMYRYPVGRKGSNFNEFELDQIIIFLAATHIDDYVPSCFETTRKRKERVRTKSGEVGLGADDPGDGDRSGNAESWRGLLEDELDVDSVLADLGAYVHGSDSTEPQSEDVDDDGLEDESGDDS